MAAITIKDVQVITANLTGKKFAYRNKAVESVVTDYLKPLIIGRDVDAIEDLWHLMSNNGYWRKVKAGGSDLPSCGRRELRGSMGKRMSPAGTFVPVQPLMR